MFPKRLSITLLTDIGLVLLVAVTRVFSASRLLHKWDSVQFALALSDYDIARHQPHPPGYPGYVALGWIARRFVPDDNAAFVIVGVLSSAVLAIAVHHIGRALIGRRGGFFAGILASLNPLVWYFSSIALAYMAGVTVATLAVWAALEARGRMKWFIPVLAAAASVIWLPVGILVFPVAAWGFLQDRENGRSEHGVEGTSMVLRLTGFVALFLLALAAGYLPAIRDTGGLGGYLAEIQSESGKHVLRFARWMQGPLDEFIETTGSLAQFLAQGLGLGRWLLLALLIPITGETGCSPRRVVGVLPLAVAGFIALHWGTDHTLRTAGILAFSFTAWHLLPAAAGDAHGLLRRRLLTWWIAPGLGLFVLVYVNYVGILTIFLPPLILMEAWAIEKAAVFMTLQTIRDSAGEGEKVDSGSAGEGVRSAPAARRDPDPRVERLVAWLLVAFVAMNDIGGFIDSGSQESLKGIVARDYWIGTVVEAIEAAPVPTGDLVVLGGEDDYRHWTYYLPEAETIWTKYLLYNPIRQDTRVWVSRDRHQEKVLPELRHSDGGAVAAVFDVSGSRGIVVFADELERFAGSALVMPLLAPEETDSEPVCWLVEVSVASRIVFSEGEWRLE